MSLPLTQPNLSMATKIAATIPGMAHWAGSGPAGKTCGQCKHFVEVSRGIGKSTRCQRYSQMMDGKVGPKKLPPETFACKYFEQKSK